MKHNLPIAIIGMGCLFPKAQGLKAYWRLLFQSIDAITEVPKTHWQPKDYFDPDPKTPDHVYCKRGGFLSKIPFDPSEFGIPPSSLEATDTSQLLGLMVAKMALEDAGYGADKNFDRDRVSVVLGVTGTQELVIPLGARLGHPIWRRALQDSDIPPDKINDIIARISDGYVSWQENSFPGLLGNVVAGRICNRLNVGGTNCVVDAACASSMSAIHVAMLELQSERCDMVITGGIDALNDIFMHMCFAKTHILSPTGDARPFSKNADGTVLGEGLGTLILKRLDDAQRDGDRIYAVVRGIGTSSDGKSQSIYAPRAEGQARALSLAYQFADVDPATVDLLEAHGTGTRVGDAVEFSALKHVFGEPKNGAPKCALGSVKSMIGHTKAAAGAAGIIKTVLALHHKVLPPTLKSDPLDPALEIEASSFYINSQPRPWFSRNGTPRRAGVSSFGFGGSNFHVVLEEYNRSKSEIAWDGSVEIIAFSGATRADVEKKLAEFIQHIPQDFVGKDFAVQAAASRKSFSCKDSNRLLFVIDPTESPTNILTQTLNKMKALELSFQNGIFFGDNELPGKLAFVFPGQGSQYVGMAKDIVSVFPDAFEILEMNDRQYLQRTQDTYRLTDTIYPIPAISDLQKQAQEQALRQTNLAQPAIGAVSIGWCDVLRYFNIRPDAACGHSFGELAALRAADWINTETFLDLAITRGAVMANAGRDKGCMLAVHAPLDEIERVIREASLDVILANRNSPEQGVLSGTNDAISRAEAVCREKGLRCKKLPVSAAFHSKLMHNARQPFREALNSANIRPNAIPVFSNKDAAPYPKDVETIKNILADQLIHPVNFIDEIKNLYDSGISTFIEVGPKTVLTNLIRSILKGNDFHALSVDLSSGKQSGIKDLAGVSCYLAALGYPVELNRWENAGTETAKQRMSIPISGANYRSQPKTQRLKPNIAPKPAIAEAKPHSKNIQKSENKKPRITEKREIMENKIVQPSQHQTHTKPLTPVYRSYTPVSEALQVVQEGLKSMQALQSQTTEAHKKFLDTQTEAGRTLQRMMDHIQRLSDVSAGIPPMERASMPGTTVYREIPQPTIAHQPPKPVQQAIAKPPVPEIPAIQRPKPAPVAACTPPKTPYPKPPESHAPKVSVSEKTLLDVVCELTGYPAEMLSLDMDIEADLGIDSIKRVEILSTLEEKTPGLPPISPEIMGTMKTLRQIFDYLSEINSVSCDVSAAVAPAQNKTHESYQKTTAIAASTPHRPAPAVQEKTLLQVVSELTGYPTEMLTLDMDIEADLGIDSIKRVEILSTLEEKIPNLPPLSPEIMGTLKTLKQILEYMDQSQQGNSVPETRSSVVETIPADAPHAFKISGLDLNQTLLDVVSHLTGYPVEMLTLEMDIEADLGIDSIKRVEILSALEEKIPGIPPLSPEIIGTLKTLGHIVNYMSSMQDKSSMETHEPLNTSVPPLKPHSNTVRRRIVKPVESPFTANSGMGIAPDRCVYIADDTAGELGKAIEAELASKNIRSMTLPMDQLMQKDNRIPASGLLILAGGTGNAAFLKKAFHLTQLWATDLLAAANNGGALFATVSRMDGMFGFSGQPIANPFQGGLSGLAKTAAVEWKDVRCHALDVTCQWNDPSEIAKKLVSEIFDPQGPVEIGLLPDKRLTFDLADQPYPDGDISLTREDVIVISGGARGVTAEAALVLAEQIQPALVLLGRSPEPLPEPEWLANIQDDASMKKAILKNDFQNRAVSPLELEKAFKKYRTHREILDNLARLKSAGARVKYYSADIQDSDRIGSVLNDVRRTMGPIKGIVHGAGMLEDRLIVDKTPEQFDRVFDTKVKGLKVLLDHTRNDSLKYIVLFSSVAARFGNRGQVDYAMANEVLNKVAGQEAHARPDCRVISINWGPWDGGMVTPGLKREFARNHIELIPLRDGAVSMFQEMKGAPGHSVEVILGDGFQAPQVKLAESSEDGNGSRKLNLTFKREVDVNTYPILESHILDGKPVVPFALMTEWLGHGALHENPGLGFVGLDDIRLLNGIKITRDKQLVRLMAGKARKVGAVYEVDVEIRNGKKDGGELIHSRARAILSENLIEPPPFRLKKELIAKPYPRNTEQIYEDILFHGPQLHGILEIIGYSSMGIAAKVSTAPAPEKWIVEPLRNRWIGDPLVLDSACQLAIVWCYEEKGIVSLPSYSASYRQYRHRFPSEDIIAVLEIRDVTSHKVKGDFTFLDSDHRVIAQMTGYEAIMDASLSKAFGIQDRN